MLSSRRRFLKLSAGTLLAAGAWPGCARHGETREVKSLKFIEVNDLHFAEDACVPYFEKLVAQMNTYDGVACCLVVGDLADGGTIEQMSAIKAILSKLKMPYKVVVGNHDYKTQSDRSAYEATFPHSINYTFEMEGWRFMGLDTTDGLKYQNVWVNADTRQYVFDTLRTVDKTQPIVLFTHFPMGQAAKYRLTNADETLDLFREHNLQTVFNGHYHAYTKSMRGRLEITTDRCCSRKRDNHDGSKEKGFFLCQAGPAGVAREFVEFGGV